MNILKFVFLFVCLNVLLDVFLIIQCADFQMFRVIKAQQ